MSILCMFIRKDGVTYIEAQFNHSKVNKLWKMVKSTLND